MNIKQMYPGLPKAWRASKTARKRYRQQGGKCLLCGEPLDDTTNIDHFVPRSKGGADNWGNKCFAHEPCNLRKSNTMPTCEEVQAFKRMIGHKVAA